MAIMWVSARETKVTKEKKRETNMTNAIRTVTVTTKYGIKTIQRALTPVEAVQAILADPKASNFALDLTTKSARLVLSPKQIDWAVFLAQEALDRYRQAN